MTEGNETNVYIIMPIFMGNWPHIDFLNLDDTYIVYREVPKRSIVIDDYYHSYSITRMG